MSCVTCMTWGAVGRWYLRVHGTTAFTAATVIAIYGSPTRLINHEVLRDLSGTAGSVRYYWIRVLGSNPHRLTLRIGTSKGDADLYGRFWDFPSPYANSCPKPPKQGRHGESCAFKNPISNTVYYFAIYGATDYSGLKITVTFG